MFCAIGLYISDSLGILFTPQSLHRSGEASWRRVLTLLFSNFTKKILGSRGYLGIIPMVLWQEHCSWCLLTFRGCGSVSRSWSLRCCRHNFVVAALEYLSFADIENLFYAVVGEITSTPPSTGAGVREYCHNLYNRCFSKVEVDGFQSFFSVMCWRMDTTGCRNY